MKRIFLFFFLIWFIPIQILAQETNDTINIFDMTLEELMSVKVQVGSNVIKEKKKQPASITTITKEQLELSGARSLMEALSMYVPGMFLIEDQDDVISGMRGLAPDNNSKMMLLVNGQTLNTEFFWGPPSAILNNTNFNYIDRIEIIRGPGSVILGQGALLGVINIITKNAQTTGFNSKVNGTFSGGYGSNAFSVGEAEVAYKAPKMNAYLALAYHNFEGQTLRNEGWAADKDNAGYKGGKIIDIGSKLHRGSNNNIVGNINFHDFNLNVMYFDHQKDLYNFYRDRNVFEQKLAAASLAYKKKLSDKVTIKAMIDGAMDDIGLYSVDDYTMGGTHENRAGAKLIVNLEDILKNNDMAVGAEYKYFDMGNPNYKGNNFINNNITDNVINNTDSYIQEANNQKTFGYRSQLSVTSLFFEDFYSVNNYLDFFGAIRFDNHPYWGNHISPRLGFIASPSQDLSIRMVYQEGFRGAVGLHYSGGYRQDGFLRADNFNLIENANVLHYENGVQTGTYSNILETKPEIIKGLELTIDYNLNKQFNVYAVGFYNTIENVIDVGVIWEDNAVYNVPEIGTDVPGDWNGYWYFKNTEGQIKQAGFELNTTFKNKVFLVNASHSFVNVLQADQQQLGSMYLTKEQHFKAFPENVSRLNTIITLNKSFNIGINYMYYYKWFSPTDQEVKSNHLLNFALMYNVKKKFFVNTSVTNLLNQQRLYPMNSNVGDTSLSDGTPSIESIGIWVKLSYKF